MFLKKVYNQFLENKTSWFKKKWFAVFTSLRTCFVNKIKSMPKPSTTKTFIQSIFQIKVMYIYVKAMPSYDIKLNSLSSSSKLYLYQSFQGQKLILI